MLFGIIVDLNQKHISCKQSTKDNINHILFQGQGQGPCQHLLLAPLLLFYLDPWMLLKGHGDGLRQHLVFVLNWGLDVRPWLMLLDI